MEIKIGDRVRVTSFDEEGLAAGLYVGDDYPVGKTGVVTKYVSNEFIAVELDGWETRLYPSFFFAGELEVVDEDEG